MKKFLAIVMSLAMVLSLCAGAFAATEADLSTEPEFDPNPDYDKWTVVEYTIEAIQADLVCTVSAKEDNSEFYLECNFYGDDQMTRTTYDGENYEVLEDITGFMGGDTPAILDIAIEQDLWIPMNGGEEAAGEKKFTEADLPTEPEFDPNPDYDMWTVVEYTIEAIQADLVCTVSAKKDFSEFYQECNFYGDDQMSRTTWDGENYEVLDDLTGFMAGDTPAILDKAMEQGIWIYFDDEDAAEAPAEGFVTEADLPTEPEFDPNPDYDMWTVVEYTIEAIQADLVCTVSAKSDFSEFYQECNFYGDDQMSRTTWDGENYEVLEDLTGFMGGDTPAILDKAMEQNLWVPMA